MMELESEMRKQKRRTVIEPIENKPYMRTTFSKRRNGLFKKSKELTKLTGCEIAILVLSEAGRPYSFAAGPGNPTLDQILDLYTSGSFCPAAPNRHNKQLYGIFSRRRDGLFKKSGELSKLCSCQIALLILSPTLGGRPYCFSAGPHYPSFDDVVHAYFSVPTTLTRHSSAPYTPSSSNFMSQGASSSSSNNNMTTGAAPSSSHDYYLTATTATYSSASTRPVPYTPSSSNFVCQEASSSSSSNNMTTGAAPSSSSSSYDYYLTATTTTTYSSASTPPVPYTPSSSNFMYQEASSSSSNVTNDTAPSSSSYLTSGATPSSLADIDAVMNLDDNVFQSDPQQVNVLFDQLLALTSSGDACQTDKIIVAQHQDDQVDQDLHEEISGLLSVDDYNISLADVMFV